MATSTGECRQAKDYGTNPSADWALCALNGEPSGMIHETVNSNNNAVKKDMKILLSGFGCISPTGGNSDPVYRVGTSSVAFAPSAETNDLETRGGAAVCFGDSGGPAFVVSPEAISNPGNEHVLTNRLLVSVNSRGTLIDVSVLASTSTPMAQAFFKWWTTDAASPGSGLKICGFSIGALSCRELPQ